MRVPLGLTFKNAKDENPKLRKGSESEIFWNMYACNLPPTDLPYEETSSLLYLAATNSNN